MIDAPDQERQGLAEMAEHDLEPRIGVEHAAEHHADRQGRGFHRVAPGGAHHHREVLGVVVVIGVHHRRQRQRGMQIDRHVERLRALVDRPEPLVVEKHVIGEPVQHGALEAELAHGALELVGGGLRIAGR
jgi:hypothetical protein